MFFIFASIVSWTITIVKVIEITLAKRDARRALQLVLNAQTFARLAASFKGKKGAGVIFLKETLKEIYLSTQQIDFVGSENLDESRHADVYDYEDVLRNGGGEGIVRKANGGIEGRVHSLLSRCSLAIMRRVACGTTVLATIGAVAPFIGLFATVWGIMNSFIGIAESHTTRLDVVAPGIAEALLATAVGLFVAIPAVIMYNSFARALNSYRSDLGDIATAIERLLSRELDRQRRQANRKNGREL